MTDKPKKMFHVATYAHPVPGKVLKVSHVVAYTNWYNQMWHGYVGFEVEAENGDEAKRIAKQKRVQYEQEKAAGITPSSSSPQRTAKPG